ncbi:MAG TPA: hypothetical protein VFO94_17960 [Gammaproteobacteria bacterium]|nr:hypothetical protein [Gammaproteobacteria bacterium]
MAGTAAADDASKESMAMHQKMLDDCVAKQDPATDKHAAMKACIDMLDKQMAGKEMANKGMAGKAMPDNKMSEKHAPDEHVYADGAASHSMPHDEHAPRAGMPHEEAVREAPRN